MQISAAFVNDGGTTESVNKGYVGSLSSKGETAAFYGRMIGLSEEDSVSLAKSLEEPIRMDATTELDPSYLRVNPATRPQDIKWQILKTHNWYYMYGRMNEYERNVSVLSTLILTIVDELTRYDIIFRPKFAHKCLDCHHETKEFVTECPKCHSQNLVTPDETQKKYFTKPGTDLSFIDCADNNGKTLKDKLKMYIHDQILFNQGYLVCSTTEYFDPETGERDKSQRIPAEFLVIDPMKIKAEINDAGEFGKTKAFCVDDRRVAYSLDEAKDEEELQLMNEEGKYIYPVAWTVGSNLGAVGNNIYYMQEEVYQNQWFRPSLVYGVPIWYDIEWAMRTWTAIELHFWKRMYYGYIRKVLIMPGFNDMAAAGICKGITEVLQKNDNSIPIVCLPPQMQGVAQMTAQALDLGTEDSNAIIALKDEIRDRLCAHVGVPNLFVGDVESSGGMNNESQQITRFDRALMGKMAEIDNLLKWVLHWFPGITDWELVLDRPTKSMTDAKNRIDKLDTMTRMKQAGFKVEFDGEDFHYSKVPMDQEMQELELEKAKMELAQMQMQFQQMMMGPPPGAENQTPPSENEGPQERGSKRREDPEVDASKEETEEAQKEAAV